MQTLKKKGLTTLIAAILMFSMVFAIIPTASASPLTSAIEFVGEGTHEVEWALAPALGHGSYSVKLSRSGDDWVDWAGVRVLCNIPLSDFAVTAEGYLDVGKTYFYYYGEGTSGQVPVVAFIFEVPEDPDGLTTWKLLPAICPPADEEYSAGSWIKAYTTHRLWGLGKGSTAEKTWIEFQTGFTWGLGDPQDVAFDWWMTNDNSPIKDKTVKAIEISIGTQTAVVYVDDIEINGITYPLEPIVLDAEWYKTGDTVTVTVVDAYANVRPEVAETIEVTAASNYPDQITVELTETDVNTGIFEGSFSLVEEIPGLLVRDGSIVTVTYEGLSDTATVDDTDPTIAIVSPAEVISVDTPLISADLSDDASGLASATMKLDGEIVAMKTWPPPTPSGTISYTVPSFAPLDEGAHTVQVIVSDVAGNPATETLSFTVDLTKPTVSVVVEPDPAKADTVKFTLTFNQDMDKKVHPTVKFGKVSPYTTHTVTPVGWTDGRVWEGTFPVTTATGDGLNTIRVSGAKDVAGNEMDIDTTNTFVIDTVAPTEPDLAAPTATDVSITLTWTASTDEDGTGVELYEIWRKKGVEDYELVTWVFHPTTTYTDYGPLEEATYYYKVVAVDYAENEATSDTVSIEFIPGVVIAYPVELVEDWNLVSLPLIPEDPSIEVVLVDVSDDVEVVWSYSYDEETDTWSWSYYLPAVPELGELTEMVDGAGYWVKMTADAELIVYGTELPEPPAVPPVYHVYAGWNLIGFKEIDEMPVTEYLTTIPEELKEHMVIYGWNAADQRYELVCVGLPKVAPDFDPGQGYWLYLIDEAYIAPP